MTTVSILTVKWTMSEAMTMMAMVVLAMGSIAKVGVVVNYGITSSADFKRIAVFHLLLSGLEASFAF